MENARRTRWSRKRDPTVGNDKRGRNSHVDEEHPYKE
jgi:hypothetical protein